MKKVIVIPRCVNVDFDANAFLFAVNCGKASGTNRFNETLVPYELHEDELEYEFNNDMRDDRYIRFIDTADYVRDLMGEVKKILHQQPDGSKVNINDADTLASIVKTGNSYIYTIGTNFGSIDDLSIIAGLFDKFIIKNRVKILNIKVEMEKQDDWLFDIYAYAAETEYAMLSQFFKRHAVNGVMTLPTNNHGNGFCLAMLTGMGFDTVELKSISKEDNFFSFTGMTENDEVVELTMEELPPKGIAYLIEYLVQNNY
jgi:hypothetical protein